jgi:hypothetical protein
MGSPSWAQQKKNFSTVSWCLRAVLWGLYGLGSGSEATGYGDHMSYRLLDIRILYIITTVVSVCASDDGSTF